MSKYNGSSAFTLASSHVIVSLASLTKVQQESSLRGLQHIRNSHPRQLQTPTPGANAVFATRSNPADGVTIGPVRGVQNLSNLPVTSTIPTRSNPADGVTPGPARGVADIPNLPVTLDKPAFTPLQNTGFPPNFPLALQFPTQPFPPALQPQFPMGPFQMAPFPKTGPNPRTP
jgi:hypothetical protein